MENSASPNPHHGTDACGGGVAIPRLTFFLSFSHGQVTEFAYDKSAFGLSPLMDPIPEGISSAAGIIPVLAGKLPEPGPGPHSVGTVPVTVVSFLCVGWFLTHPSWLSGSSCSEVSCVSPGSMRVLQDPTCFSDYISISTCEWEMAGPTNCRAELHLSYQLNFYYSE